MHAYEVQEYLDYTGYMGGAIIGYHDRIGFPQECYNAANLNELGWFSDKTLVVDMFTPTLVNLAAFVDYDKTQSNSDMHVIVQSQNLFMHYNRAKNQNQNTTEYHDHFTIYQQFSYGTQLFAALHYNDRAVYQHQFAPGTYTAEICDMVMGNGYSTPDYLVVSIGFGASLCSEVQKTANSIIPPPVSANSSVIGNGGVSSGTSNAYSG